MSEKQNPGTARQHPVHTSKRPRHDTHTASVVFIESVDAQSFIVIVSKSHPVDPQTPQLLNLGSKLSRTAQWPACKTLPWMKTRGHKKTKERLVQPSRAEQQRGGNVSELFVCCSVLFSEVSFWSDVWGQTVPEVTTRFYNTSQLKMMWTGAGFMSHSALQLVTSRTPSDAKTQRGIWDDSSCCDRAVLLVLLRILNPEDTILLDSSVLCESNMWWNNQTDSSDRSLWDYATWKQDEINHAGFILIDVVISVWFWIGSDSDSSFSLTNTLKIMIMWRLLESVANVSSHLSSFHPVRSHFSPFIQKIKASAILELVLVLILRFWLYFY